MKIMKELREAFLENTADIRRELMENQALLQEELAGVTPDVTRLSEIQKKISALRTKMDEFRLAHMLEMKEANPDLVASSPYGTGHGTNHNMESGKGHAGERGMTHAMEQGAPN